MTVINMHGPTAMCVGSKIEEQDEFLGRPYIVFRNRFLYGFMFVSI